MNTITMDKKEKSVLQQLRDIRDNISEDIQHLSYEQLVDYLNKQQTLHEIPKNLEQKQVNRSDSTLSVPSGHST